METEAREIIHSRDCYTATINAPARRLPADRTDRALLAAHRAGSQDWINGRHVHVAGCPDAK